MASEIKVDTISEKTSANGVSIDSVSLKDGKVATANSIDSDAYVDGSIDNAHIADDAIDSEHYAAGSIDTAHIADDQITLAKMAGGTDGNIISYDASGDPVAIATGTAGHFLKSAGAGAPPVFAAAGGAWTFIKSITASGAGDVQFVNGTSSVVLDSTYVAYKIYGFNISTDDDDDVFKGQYSDDTGSSYETSSYITRVIKKMAASTVGGTNDTTSAFYINALGTGTEENLSFEWTIYNPADNSSYTHSNFMAIFKIMSAGEPYHNTGGSVYEATDDIDAIKF